MPVDVLSISTRFAAALTAAAAPMGPLFARLSDAVKDLAQLATKGERATRAYPTLRYYNGALTVYVDTLGGPLLRAPNSVGIVDGLRAGGADLVAGLAWPETAVTQELALPTLLDVARQAVEGARSSITRVATPKPGMFDPRAGQLSDTIGLLVLAYRGLVGRDAHDQLVGSASAAGSVLGALSPTADSPAQATVAAADAGDGVLATLSDVSEAFADALLLLPMLGDTLTVALSAATSTAKRGLLARLSSVEQAAYALRAAVLGEVIAVSDHSGLATATLTTARLTPPPSR